MLKENGNDFQLYVQQLTKLKPILQQLSNITRIVWKIQAPGPLFVTSSVQHDFAFTAQIPHYNSKVREVLK